MVGDKIKCLSLALLGLKDILSIYYHFWLNWDVWLACDSTGFELSCHKSQYFSLICSNNHLSISMEKKRSITLKLQTLLRKDEKRVNKYTLFVHMPDSKVVESVTAKEQKKIRSFFRKCRNC